VTKIDKKSKLSRVTNYLKNVPCQRPLTSAKRLNTTYQIQNPGQSLLIKDFDGINDSAESIERKKSFSSSSSSHKSAINCKSMLVEELS